MSKYKPVDNKPEEIQRFALCSREETESLLKKNKLFTADQIKKGLKISSYIDNKDYPLVNVFLLSGVFLNTYEEFPSEQPEQIIGIKLSKKYKLIKGWDEQMLGIYIDMLYQFFESEILKKIEIRNFYEKTIDSLLIINPILKSFEKILIMNPGEALSGIISRFDPNDIASFIMGIRGSESYSFYGDNIEFIKSVYKKAKFHYVLSPYSVNKIINHIKKNKTLLRVSEEKISKLNSVNLLKIVKELHPV